MAMILGSEFEVNYILQHTIKVHPILVQEVTRESFFISDCLQSSAFSHPSIVHGFLGVYNPDDQSPLPVLMMEESLTSLVKKVCFM